MLPALSDPKTDALKKVSLFARCTDRELRFVASEADEVNIDAGRTLIRQGEPGNTFYVLLEGEAEVVVDGKNRRTIRAGDYFGEISMLDGGPATATVVTRTPVRAMVMSHSQFRDAIKGNEDLLIQVLAAVAGRLRADSLERERKA